MRGFESGAFGGAARGGGAGSAGLGAGLTSPAAAAATSSTLASALTGPVTPGTEPLSSEPGPAGGETENRMRIIAKDGKLSPALAGVPIVFARSQGGLHDVVLDRDYAQSSTIYFCFAEPANVGGARTSLARARLVDEGTPRLDDVKVIFRQEGPLSSGNHFGCRIAQARDGNLFLTMGDHFAFRNEAQNLANLTGWPLANVLAKMAATGQPTR